MGRVINVDDLVDCKMVNINYKLPEDERYLDFVRQIKNPFYFRDGEDIIKIRYKKLLPPFEIFTQMLAQGIPFEYIIADHIRQSELQIEYLLEDSSSDVVEHEDERGEESSIDNFVDISTWPMTLSIGYRAVRSA